MALTRLERDLLDDPVVQFVRWAEPTHLIADRYPLREQGSMAHCVETLDVLTEFFGQAGGQGAIVNGDRAEHLVALRLAAILHVACDVLTTRACAMRWALHAENVDDLLHTFLPMGFDGVNEILRDAGGRRLEDVVWSCLGSRESRPPARPPSRSVHPILKAACERAFYYWSDSADLTPFPTGAELIVLPGIVDATGQALDLADTVTNLRAVEFSDATLRALADNPALLGELSPSRFEHLVAELLRREGCSQVVVTGGPRDEGVDIWAVRTDELGSMLLLAQCKRYRASPIDLSIVQRFFGVVTAKHATVGLVATTSRFTRPARAFAEQRHVEGRMTLKDLSALITWLGRAVPRSWPHT